MCKITTFRLTIPLALLILFTIGIGPVLGQGPNWIINVIITGNCRDSWWANLLYVNNYVISTVRLNSLLLIVLSYKLMYCIHL